MEVYMKGIVLKIKSPKNYHNRKNNITYFVKRYGIFAMFLVSILVGFILGIYCGVNTGLEFKESFDFLFPTDFTDRASLDYLGVFSCNFAPIFIFFVAIFLLGFCPWGNGLTPVVTMFKGFGMGLSLTTLCSISGLKGFGFFLLAMIPGFFISSASLALQGEKTFHLSANVFKVIIKKENISLELREFVEDSATCLFIAMVGSVVDSVLFLLLYFHFYNI